MDIDVDWCLTCQKHIEGPYPYCSPFCQFRAAPTAYSAFPACNDNDDDNFDASDDQLMLDTPSSSTTSRWLGNDYVGIAAWAADIPPNAPPTIDDTFSLPDHVHPRRAALNKTHRALPNLLKSSRRVAPPCLFVSTTLPANSSKSSPILAPSRHSSTGRPARAREHPSLSKCSSKSAQTESPVSTPSCSHHESSVPVFSPSRKSSILDDVYIHVRSWVAPAIIVPVKLPHQQPQPTLAQGGLLKQVQIDHPTAYQETSRIRKLFGPWAPSF